MSSIEIDLKDTDRNFLINLQKELLTQTTDGNADPRYWGVKVKKRIYGFDSDYADGWEVVDAGAVCTVGDANNIASVIKEAILDYGFSTDDFDEDNDKYTYGFMDNIDDVVLRMNEVARLHDCGDINDSCNYFDVSYFRDIYEVVDEAVFLTKKACMEHIKKNAHNYNDPHTYVMTAFRCPEYERLLKILKETDWAAETTPRIVTNVNSTGGNSIFIDHVNKLEI